MSNIAKYKLEITVFICGAITMILELAGSRVIAPYFGNSLYVWTGLIGVILGCMSLGYYFGGLFADRKQATTRNLSLLVLFAGLLIAFSAFIKEPLLYRISVFVSDIETASLVSVFLLFGFPSFLLAMISPYAAKIKIEKLDVAGGAVGKISSLSTLGSIVGTFSAGFYLIPAFGNSNLMYLMALILVLLSIFLDKKQYFIQLLFILIIGSLFYFNTSLKVNKIVALADIDTQYNRIIVGHTDLGNGQDFITMKTDNSGIQTAVYADGKDDLVADYLIFFDKTKPGLNIINKDARVYARNAAIDKDMTKYDAVLLDAFNAITPPYYLTTKEFFADLSNSLNDDGFVMINMISSFEGENSEFLKSEYTTLKKVFPKVEIYPIGERNKFIVQNISIVAYKNTDSSLPLPKYNMKENSAVILTDDNAPVEQQTRFFNLATK